MHGYFSVKTTPQLEARHIPAASLDHLVGASKQRWWDSEAAGLAVLRLIVSAYFLGFCTGRSAGFSPFRMRST
jgi:hypothetical protein